MIALVCAAGVAALVSGPWSRDMVRTGLSRVNYRARVVAFPAGAILVACSLIALAPLALLDDRADLNLIDGGLRRWLPYVLGVALLGLLDDALGRGAESDTARGWRGHARAIAAGRFSTGAIKAVGSLALAAFVISGEGHQGFDYVVGILLLLLTTNLFNLLDLRPGRVEKVFLAGLVGLCIGTQGIVPLEVMGLFIGPVIVVGWLTLRERAMLGDSGSNLIGAVAGVLLVLLLSDFGRIVALAVVVALTIYGEFFSITRTIERIPPLRWLDNLGRAR